MWKPTQSPVTHSIQTRMLPSSCDWAQAWVAVLGRGTDDTEHEYDYDYGYRGPPGTDVGWYTEQTHISTSPCYISSY